MARRSADGIPPDKRRINPSALRLFIRRIAPHFKGGGILTQERKDQLLKEALKLIGTHLDEDENVVRALQQHLGMTATEIAQCGFQSELTTDMRLAFSMKLLECYDRYLNEWEKLTPGKLIAQAEEIHIAHKLTNELPNMLSYSEMEYLLRFKNPLEVAVEIWRGSVFAEIGEEEFRSVMFEARERGGLDSGHELTEDAAAKEQKAAKPRHQSQER